MRCGSIQGWSITALSVRKEIQSWTRHTSGAWAGSFSSFHCLRCVGPELAILRSSRVQTRHIPAGRGAVLREGCIPFHRPKKKKKKREKSTDHRCRGGPLQSALWHSSVHIKIIPSPSKYLAEASTWSLCWVSFRNLGKGLHGHGENPRSGPQRPTPLPA